MRATRLTPAVTFGSEEWPASAIEYMRVEKALLRVMRLQPAVKFGQASNKSSQATEKMKIETSMQHVNQSRHSAMPEMELVRLQPP
jgi:hypothetical protein